ncbi:MAG: PEGA domain-containing protein [Terriglobales bacterium]
MRGMWKTTTIAAIALTIAVGSAVAKDKNAQEMVMSFSVSVDRVYAAAVQVASAGYNLKSAVKEAYTVNFFTGGKFSMVVSAICHDSGNGQTVVTLSIAPAEGNPQIFGLGGEKNKLAKRFWTQLESTLSTNEMVEAKGSSKTESTSASVGGERLADVTVKSTPDGADIMVDGKFSGNTPSTLHISAGDHKLTITNKGFQNWVRDITLSPGGTITVNAVLEPESAK